MKILAYVSLLAGVCFSYVTGNPLPIIFVFGAVVAVFWVMDGRRGSNAP